MAVVQAFMNPKCNKVCDGITKNMQVLLKIMSSKPEVMKTGDLSPVVPQLVTDLCFGIASLECALVQPDCGVAKEGEESDGGMVGMLVRLVACVCDCPKLEPFVTEMMAASAKGDTDPGALLCPHMDVAVPCLTKIDRCKPVMAMLAPGKTAEDVITGCGGDAAKAEELVAAEPDPPPEHHDPSKPKPRPTPRPTPAPAPGAGGGDAPAPAPPASSGALPVSSQVSILAATGLLASWLRIV